MHFYILVNFYDSTIMASVTTLIRWGGGGFLDGHFMCILFYFFPQWSENTIGHFIILDLIYIFYTTLFYCNWGYRAQGI